jgi:uncharacterized repeat protein (TIGR01451 family)
LAAFSQSGQDLTWNFTNLTSNVSGTITLVATVDNSAVANVPIVNSAGVRSGDPARTETDPLKLADNFDTAEVTVIKPDLGVESTWPGGVLRGADFTYVITATNFGTGDASDVLITDTLPADITFLPAGSTTPTTQTGQLLTWQIDTLAAGQSQAFQVHVQLDPAVAANQQRTNRIDISGTPADDAAAPNPNFEEKTLVVGVIPDLSVSTAGFPSKATPGTQFCFNINYRYDPAGAPQTTDVVIKDTLPQYLSLVSQTSNPNLTFNGATSGELSWTRASMSAGDSGSIAVCVKVSASASTKLVVNNVVTIAGSFDAILTGNNVDTKALEFGDTLVYLPIIMRAP